jgi:hypothetical protein
MPAFHLAFEEGSERVVILSVSIRVVLEKIVMRISYRIREPDFIF